MNWANKKNIGQQAEFLNLSGKRLFGASHLRKACVSWNYTTGYDDKLLNYNLFIVKLWHTNIFYQDICDRLKNGMDFFIKAIILIVISIT